MDIVAQVRDMYSGELITEIWYYDSDFDTARSRAKALYPQCRIDVRCLTVIDELMSTI